MLGAGCAGDAVVMPGWGGAHPRPSTLKWLVDVMDGMFRSWSGVGSVLVPGGLVLVGSAVVLVLAMVDMVWPVGGGRSLLHPALGLLVVTACLCLIAVGLAKMRWDLGRGRVEPGSGG